MRKQRPGPPPKPKRRPRQSRCPLPVRPRPRNEPDFNQGSTPARFYSFLRHLMAESLDQIFVTFKQGVVGLFPADLQEFVSAFLSVAVMIGVFAGLFALTTILERKGLGRIQNRYGPNRVGPFGFLQPVADGLKAMTKEDIVPRAADKVVHFLAPLVLVVPVFLALAVIPVGRNMVALDLDTGVLFFFAVGAATELSVFMAG